ncbi:MAG TPA: efflux RND transporter periplasmic adaptor subunit, partial [Rhodothermales bacterium]|nr:efflux RND transporter periplasmic adaptor subunit [Rhodothermales bacterium]
LRFALPFGVHALLLAGTVALAACGGGDEAPEAAAPEAAPLVLAATDVAVVARGQIETGISLTGSLEPYRVVEVKAQVGGTLGSVRYDAGDRVGQGAVMATIEAEGVRSQAASSQAGVTSARAGVTSAEAGVSGARAAVGAAEAQLALARERAASAQLLFSQGAMSRLDYQAAQAQVEAAQAQVVAARSQVVAAQGQVTAARGQVASAQTAATSAGEQAARTYVRAPFSGAVSIRQVEPGEAVTSGQTLFTVVSTSALEMAAQVGADEVGRVQVGAPVTFRLDAYPGETFSGRVSRIEPTADPASRQVGVYLQLANPGDMVGGLFATGTIVTGAQAGALLVPESALRDATSGAAPSGYLLVIDDGVLRRRAVRVTGRDRAQGLISVEGEVQVGDRVVVAPTTDAVDGRRVTLAGAARTAERPATPAAPARPDSAGAR